MAIHFSILAWRIPWTEEPDGLQSIGLPRVRQLKWLNSYTKTRGGSSTSWAVQFSQSVVSDSLRPHESQHTRPPCPLPTAGVYANPCPLSQWCHPTTSSSVVPFSSCPQSFPASGSFHMSQLFTSGGQSIWVSASTSVLPMNTQGWSPPGWTGWDLLAVQGTLKSLLQHHSSKASILRRSAFFIVQLSHAYMTTGKTTALSKRRKSDIKEEVQISKPEISKLIQRNICK